MKELIAVSFPGLGIDPFVLNKIAFSIGPLQVRWYGILITLGIVLAFTYAAWRGKRNEHVLFDDVVDLALFTVIPGIIGARLYYVLTTLGDYDYSSFYKVIAIWEGGLAIYGGIIGGCIGIFVGCKIKKLKWRRVFDMIGPGVMLAQAIGRWGNFFNGEAFGYPVGETTRYYFLNTEHILNSGEGTFFHTLRMGLCRSGSVTGNFYYYHPTFLYECVWNLVGFGLINLFYKHKKFDGQIALLYFTWYGFGRMLIEGFRTDSLYIPGTTLRISQCLGLACFTLGLLLLVVFSLLAWRRERNLELCTACNDTVVGSEEVAVTENTDATENTENTEPLETTQGTPSCEVKDACENFEQTEEKNDGNTD